MTTYVSFTNDTPQNLFSRNILTQFIFPWSFSFIRINKTQQKLLLLKWASLLNLWNTQNDGGSPKHEYMRRCVKNMSWNRLFLDKCDYQQSINTDLKLVCCFYFSLGHSLQRGCVLGTLTSFGNESPENSKAIQEKKNWKKNLQNIIFSVLSEVFELYIKYIMV